MTLRVVLFFILFGAIVPNGFPQSSQEHAIFITERYQAVIFNSDSILTIEQGGLPIIRDSVCRNDYQLVGQIKMYTDQVTYKTSFSYQKTDSLLILKRRSKSLTTNIIIYEIPYEFRGDSNLVLDFTNALEIFPHYSVGNCVNTPLLELTTIKPGVNKKWKSINMNSVLEISSNGDFQYHGYGNLSKTGRLDKGSLKTLNDLITQCPSNNQILHFMTPHDAISTHLRIVFNQSVFESNGSQSSQPYVLQKLQEFVQMVQDSVSNSIVKTNQGWIDTDSMNCLIWYNNRIISAEMIPKSPINWAGFVRHNVYVIAQSRTIKSIDYDYILYVDELEPSSKWNTPSGTHPITSNRKLLKKTLTEIEKALDEK